MSDGRIKKRTTHFYILNIFFLDSIAATTCMSSSKMFLFEEEFDLIYTVAVLRTPKPNIYENITDHR
jgi:hypothetical protein